MKRLAMVGLVFAMSGVGWAQGVESDESLFAARQHEVARLAELHSIDLKQGDWQHEHADVCPAFTRHTFVYFHRTPQPGVRTAFIAILPRQGGKAFVVPVAGSVTGDGSEVAGRSSTMKTFNQIWADEFNAGEGHGVRFQGLSWAELGSCYVRMAGEQPVIVRDLGSLNPPPPIDLKGEPAVGLMIPVAAPPQLLRNITIDLNAKGMLSKVGVLQSPSYQ